MKDCWPSFLLALLSTGRSVVAFSSGAGRCVVGEAAPLGLHLTGDPATGTLDDGGYTIIVGGETVTNGGSVAQTVGTAFDIVLEGPDFRGVLIMVAGQPDTVIVPGAGLQLNTIGTDCSGTASITHTDSELKQTASGSVTLDEPLSTTLELNVVVQNSGGLSTFYYSQVDLSVIEETAAPTNSPVATPTSSPVVPLTISPVAATPPTQGPDLPTTTAFPTVPATTAFPTLFFTEPPSGAPAPIASTISPIAAPTPPAPTFPGCPPTDVRPVFAEPLPPNCPGAPAPAPVPVPAPTPVLTPFPVFITPFPVVVAPTNIVDSECPPTEMRPVFDEPIPPGCPGAPVVR